MMIAKPATPVAVIPQQISLRLKQIKKIFKIIILLVLYLALFFGQFISGTVNLFATRGFLSAATLYSLDSSSTIQSSVTVLTSNPQFFMLNDISFGDVSDTYNCINNQFDPIYNPSFSLNTYIQTNAFIGVMVAGWIFILVVIIVKSLMVWNAGIGNKTEKDNWRYWVIYGYHELAMASVLYAHFYLFEFFYFCKVTPCFSISPFNGVEPYFDSILYLFLSTSCSYRSQPVGLLRQGVHDHVSICYPPVRQHAVLLTRSSQGRQELLRSVLHRVQSGAMDRLSCCLSSWCLQALCTNRHQRSTGYAAQYSK